jgi:predicted outer membrane repeat protein
LIVGVALTLTVLWALGATWTTKSAHAAGIVSTCDEASLLSALSGGGVITFTCSGIITFTAAPTTGIVIASDTTIDGSGQSVILDGENARRIFNVDAGIKLTLKNVTVQRGFAIGDGGAIYSLGPLVLNNARILSSTATGGSGRGGGAYAGNTLTTQDGEFRGNVADNGGGLYTNDVAQLNNTHFISNAAQFSGGGMRSQNMLLLTGGEFRQNTASFGGGLDAALPATINGAKFISNTATSSGGGATAGSTLTLLGGEFRGNTSNEGGGLLLNAPALISGTLFISNTATGFGGGVSTSYGVTVTGSEFSRNAGDSGGGLTTRAGAQALIGYTNFFSNTARTQGGGLRAFGAVTITGGEFRANRSVSGTLSSTGGGLQSSAPTLVNGVLFNDNFAYGEGGGMAVEGALTVLNTRFIRNRTTINSTALLHSGTSNGRIVNSLFADNRTPSSGAVIRLDAAGVVEVLHNTIAAPDPLSGRGIEISGGAVGVTNTIVASYTTGLIQTGGAAYENYNLLFNLTMTRTGTFVGDSGANDVVGGAPNFVNPANDDYHLVTGSAAINAGAITNVTTDIDGEARPPGSAFDIGYDEFSQRVYLPLIVR